MRIFVHIKDKVFRVSCGEGAQTVQWLGEVAVFRYSEDNGLHTGMPVGIRLENQRTVELDATINEILQDD